VAGCAPKTVFSGFRGDYSQLKRNAFLDNSLAHTNPAKDLKQSNKFILDPGASLGSLQVVNPDPEPPRQKPADPTVSGALEKSAPLSLVQITMVSSRIFRSSIASRMLPVL
jgi:hypothetical protein